MKAPMQLGSGKSVLRSELGVGCGVGYLRATPFMRALQGHAKAGSHAAMPEVLHMVQ